MIKPKFTRIAITENDMYWISSWRSECVKNEDSMSEDELRTWRKLERAERRLANA